MAGETATKLGRAGKQGFRIEDTLIWRIKLRLQFTGWLQYAINAAVLLPFLHLAASGWLIGVSPVLLIWLPLTLGGLIFTNCLFDIATVRWRLHPAEAVPRPRTGLNAFDLMRSRRSCRSFQQRNLSQAHYAALMESVQKHSKAERLIGTSPIRFEYIAAPLTVWPTVGGHEFLVAIAPHDYDRLAVIDVGRSLEKVVLDVTRMGLATCWIGPGADHKERWHVRSTRRRGNGPK